MSGIYGVLELREGSQPPEELLARMGDVIVHRGPDDYGHYRGKGMTFGMRRLSIIDLKGGHQPIANEDKSVWVICNGEIYNFRQLRETLEARGHVFRCDSDTEAIVHLYEEEGLDCFKKLRGMFAVALWDERRARLVLARDRLGKQPLYIYQDASRILFASEAKSVLEFPNVPRGLNLEALQEYLALGYVPAPSTLFQGIEKLLPGHYLVAENGQVRKQEYWDLPQSPIVCSEAEWIERVREKLLECVRVRLRSDVPVGAFLGGGIDSSAIVAAMAQLTDQPVKTYSIGFEGAHDELPYARIVAKNFRTDHHEIIVRPDIVSLFPKLIWYLDEPIADAAFVTTYLVARLASQSVKVILSGVGGDELFGGYRRYLGENAGKSYAWLPRLIRQKLLPSMTGFLHSAEWNPASRYMSYVTIFSPELQRELLSNDVASGVGDTASVANRINDYVGAYPNVTGLNQLSYLDLKTSLPDHLLALTDKMTMAQSIECRAPFTDHELVELAASMPDSLKVPAFKMKDPFHKVVEPWLPSTILNHKNRGSAVPLGSWMRGELSSMVELLLSNQQVKKRGLFNWQFIRQMVARHHCQTHDYTDHIVALINLELWCRIFLDGKGRQDSVEAAIDVSMGEVFA